nr:MAG TPA: hypothetical protein [Caudoviricetes sp.]
MLDNNLTQSRWKGQREVRALFICYILYPYLSRCVLADYPGTIFFNSFINH